MPYIVTSNCEGCKFTDCVTVCPVDCFHEGETMLYIDPEECIDCGACVDECPVQAIFAEDDLPSEEEKWTAINAEMAPQLPVITDKKDPLPGAEEKRAELGL